MDAEKLLLDNWQAVEKVVAFTCRKHGLHGADAEDFESTVKVKLFENDFAILKQFRGDSSITTYLSVVVQRIFIDMCVQAHGKWRASADAKRSGDLAMELERMVQWEGLPSEEAVQRAAAAHPDVPREEIESIAAQIPQRNRRRSTVTLDESMTQFLTSRDEADVLVVEHDRQRIEQRAAEVIRNFLESLEEQDRLMLQLRFEGGWQISDIARRFQVEAKPLYRRKDTLLQSLRKALEDAGISASDLRDIIGHFADEPDFGLRKRAASPSNQKGVR
jgi:RNA polymerase sigma factor (sigma-70 family)